MSSHAQGSRAPATQQQGSLAAVELEQLAAHGLDLHAPEDHVAPGEQRIQRAAVELGGRASTDSAASTVTEASRCAGFPA